MEHCDDKVPRLLQAAKPLDIKWSKERAKAVVKFIAKFSKYKDRNISYIICR